jgi:KDO2-lipid IV(A) lauroyltransferase
MKLHIQATLTRAVLRALALLPYGLVARLGVALGSVLYLVPGKRKHILRTNLKLCFPELSERQRNHLARATLQHVIRSYLERGFQWYGSPEALSRLVQVESAIPLEDQYETPTIFLAFHFSAIEATCVHYSITRPVASVYTPMSDKVTEAISKEQRSRFGTELIARHGSARDILKVLKTGKPVMLAADMDFGLRDSVFVPFFGVQACTLTAVSRLARLSGARVVPFVSEVLPDYQGYKLNIFPPLQDFPTRDLHADALAMNQFLEARIREAPDQYYWVHRRFKRRPVGEMPVY